MDAAVEMADLILLLLPFKRKLYTNLIDTWQALSAQRILLTMDAFTTWSKWLIIICLSFIKFFIVIYSVVKINQFQINYSMTCTNNTERSLFNWLIVFCKCLTSSRKRKTSGDLVFVLPKSLSCVFWKSWTCFRNRLPLFLFLALSLSCLSTLSHVLLHFEFWFLDILLL